ncbi:MAG: four helix bundle protein [Phycisphaeraceae bacterium]|nr:four helix bundle protein [Phycisphaeraceae bacterium]
MNEQQMIARTRDFALRVIRLVNSLPPGRTEEVLGRQLLRSATSVGANYRASRRAKSPADFISKLAIVEEEADECGYWLDLLGASGVIRHKRLAALVAECDEITAIIVASIKSAKRRRAVK